jgi:hypothetical protein
MNIKNKKIETYVFIVSQILSNALGNIIHWRIVYSDPMITKNPCGIASKETS